MISARSVTVIVIIMAVIIISPVGLVLSFFVTTLGPAFRLVVPLVVAIVALDVGFVSFPSISCECFFRAVLARAFLYDTPIVFVGYELCNYVGCNISTA